MPLVVPKPRITRIRLRNFLKGQLKSMEKSESNQGSVLKPLLQEAVEGLVALDYGESQPMFVPGDKNGSHDGTKPYTIRKLQMQALGYADLLIANNYKGKGTVIRTVAAAYGKKADAFRGWRKSPRLGKTTDLRMKSFREEVAKLDWDESHILGELTAAGAKYLKEKKLAHKSKK
jgi:hypothetical protein